MSPNQRLRIVVLGYLVRGPIGGMAWHHLQYVIGLQRLGHAVLFVEDSEDYPSCYDPTTHEVGIDPSYGIAFAKRVFRRLSFENWAYYDAHSQQWMGPAGEQAVSVCESADLVINISGVNPLRPWLASAPHRVLIDTDPVFTQVKNLTDESTRQRAEAHTDYFSFGELIPAGRSTVPDDGFLWRATRQPVLLDAWPVREPVSSRYTTVMQWQSYSPVSYAGRDYGTKQESFAVVEDLPNQVKAQLEIALGSATAPRERLRGLGWWLRDPIEAAPDPWAYQDYLSGSRGEFSVAKHAYASTNSGWFSERSACYLACGRPVIVQETGFSDFFPTGVGLHSFASLEEAKKKLETVESNYAEQCRAAREIAEEYFRSDTVLTDLIESVYDSNQQPKSN